MSDVADGERLQTLPGEEDQALTHKTGSIVPMDSVETAEAAGWLKHLYTEAQTGMRRVVALGLYAWWLKEIKLKHGRFGAWLKANVPDLARDCSSGTPKPSTALSTYMDLTRSVINGCGWTLEEILPQLDKSISRHAGNCHPGDILLLPDSRVPEQMKPFREKICRLIDGKTQRQLFLEFKTAEDLNGEVVVRAPGGDSAWEKWVREKHPEIVNGDKVPARQHVTKALRKEFDAFCTERQRRNHDPVAEAKAKQKFAEDLWNSLAQSLWVSRDKLHLLSDRVRDQVLDACVDTSNAIREMKGQRPTSKPTKGKRA